MSDEQFDKLVALLGQFGSEAYQAAYQHVLVDSVVGVIVFGLVFLAGLYLIRLGARLWAKREDRFDDELPSIFACLAGGVICSVSGIIWGNALVNLLAPRYAALEALAKLITG